MRFTSVLVCLGVTIITPAAAHAQRGANIDLQAFKPAMDSRGYITVNASQVLGHKEVSFGLVTNWAKNLLTLQDGSNSYEVTNIISPTLVGAFGLNVKGLELELGVSMPFQVMSGDRAPDSDNMTPDNPNDDLNYRFEGQGLGDMGLHLKTRFLNTSKGARIGLAAIASLYLPTASEADSWLGDRSLTPQLMMVIDKEFGATGKLKLALNAGVRLRDNDAFVDNGDGMPLPMPVTNQRVDVGTTIPFGAGISYAISQQKLDLVGEVFGAVPLSGENYQPLEAVAGLKVYLAKNSFLTIGGGVGFLPDKGGNPDVRAFLGIVFEPKIGDKDGDGIKDDVDRCPTQPEDYDQFEDSDGCPELDNDHDGIKDVDDKCPNEPENKNGVEDDDGCPEKVSLDRDGDGILDNDDSCPDDPEDKDNFEDNDGCPDKDNDKDTILDVDDLCPNDPEDHDKFEDANGCPDPDNDKDKILDKDDKCPDEPENYNGNKDEDGCPDPDISTRVDGVIHVLKKIYFEFDSAVIQTRSYHVLDAVAKTINDNDDIAVLEIQGHTDKRGSAAYNLRLSRARAKSVREYLMGKKISGSRLKAKGYGESKLIDKANTDKAHSTNRRVEFIILKTK